METKQRSKEGPPALLGGGLTRSPEGRGGREAPLLLSRGAASSCPSCPWTSEPSWAHHSCPPASASESHRPCEGTAHTGPWGLLQLWNCTSPCPGSIPPGGPNTVLRTELGPVAPGLPSWGHSGRVTQALRELMHHEPRLCHKFWARQETPGHPTTSPPCRAPGIPARDTAEGAGRGCPSVSCGCPHRQGPQGQPRPGKPSQGSRVVGVDFAWETLHGMAGRAARRLPQGLGHQIYGALTRG